MSFKSMTIGALGAALLALPAWASDISIKDAYLRVATPTAKAAGGFMVIENTGAEEDRLVGVKTDVSAKAQLHTHKMTSDGVMQMLHVEEGFVLPAGGSHALARGGDHGMRRGLTQKVWTGDVVPMVLIFEKAGEVAIELPVNTE